MPPSAPPSSLRILCFGASITAGFYSFGLHSHPYATALKTRLQQLLPSTDITTAIDGLSGDRVIGGGYFSRLATHIPSNSPRAYDWIIVQGGGNDLAWGAQPAQIFEALKRFWGIALRSGVNVLALTVTETAESCADRVLGAKYEALNAMIKDYEGREDGLWVADVCARLPYAAMEEGMRKKVWDDGLHFKPRGYDLLGEAIAERLGEVVKGVGAVKL